VKKRHLGAIFMQNDHLLPRQARDNLRESTQKKSGVSLGRLMPPPPPPHDHHQALLLGLLLVVIVGTT
jgi:hypothetical protein